MDNLQPFQRLQKKLGEIIAATPPDERLPSEPKLARALGVSRATLREAMRAFESQGYLRRRQGIGTFVIHRPHVIRSGLEVLESIETLAGKMGLNVSMGDLRIDRLPADEAQAMALNCQVGAVLVHVRRTILTGERPVAYLIDILPEDIIQPDDLQYGFNGSVLDLLLRRGSPPLAKSIADIQAEPAPLDIARALQIQRGDVLLVFNARLFDVSGRVVDISTSYFLPGYFHFHIVRSVMVTPGAMP